MCERAAAADESRGGRGVRRKVYVSGVDCGGSGQWRAEASREDTILYGRNCKGNCKTAEKLGVCQPELAWEEVKKIRKIGERKKKVVARKGEGCRKCWVGVRLGGMGQQSWNLAVGTLGTWARC